MKMRWTLGFVALVLALSLSCSGDKVKVGDDAGTGDTVEVMSSEAVEATVEPDACVPQCTILDGEYALKCGVSDGCGGSCSCPSSHECVDDDSDPPFCFDFDADCKEICAGKWGAGTGAECGFIQAFMINSMSDKTLCDCGACPDGQVCISEDEIDGGYCCTPDCDGRECWDNGCGGSCGTCPETSPVCVCDEDDCSETACPNCPPECEAPNGECDSALCELPCTSYCDGKECGGDGCGGICGECPEGYECKAGTCEEEGGCVPDCVVKDDWDEYLSECGTPDGCGGTCGPCEPDEVCALADFAEIGICFNSDENCPGICEFEEAECGSVWAGFVWPDCECGECAGEQETCVNNKCVCQPDCQDKECGPDGCGGSCGDCACCDFICEYGQCQCLCHCDCTGKECGPNGCGGVCGTCPEGKTCTGGVCE